MSQFKLAAKATYTWPVTVALATDDGKFKDHKVLVLFARKTRSEVTVLQEKFEKDGDEAAMLRALVVGWVSQEIVLDANDQPAAYSPEALEYMLDTPGAGVALMNAYNESFNGGLRRKNS